MLIRFTDVVQAMSEDAGVPVKASRRWQSNPKHYLMQFQSNIADAGVLVPDSEELSAIGPAHAAGLQLNCLG